MKSIVLNVDFYGEKLEAEISEDATLVIHGYDDGYSKSMIEFGEDWSRCYKLIKLWNQGLYFKSMYEFVLSKMETRDLVRIFCGAAEHALNLVKEKTQPEDFHNLDCYINVIGYLSLYASGQVEELEKSVISQHHDYCVTAAHQAFAASDYVKTSLADATINLLEWLTNRVHGFALGMDYVNNFSGFLAEAVGLLESGTTRSFDYARDKEILWQVRYLVSSLQPS